MKLRSRCIYLIMVLFYLDSLTAASNKELKIGITQEFENLNPIVKNMRATSYIYKMVGRNLLTIDHNGKWQMQLATKYPTFKNMMAGWKKVGKKKKLWSTWIIKENAKWGDGQPVTGHDVAFSLKVAMTNTVSVAGREVYENVEKIEIDPKKPKKFTFWFKKGKWDYNQMFEFEIIPKHLEEKIFEKYKDQPEGYAKNSLYTTKPTHPGLYNGPYLIQEVKLGSHLILTPNSHFYGNPPNIKKVILKLIPNTSTLEANLLSGNIDMISILGVSFDQALSLDKKIRKQKLPFRVNFKPSLMYEHIDLQLNNKVLQDIRVRKALLLSINRDELSKALFEGKQIKANHFLAPADPWFVDDPKYFVSYPYSRRKAKRLLKKAGWIQASDGYRYKNGKRFELSFMTTTGNNLRELVQVYLKEQWKKVGLHVEIKNEPARVLFGETWRKSKYTGMVMYAWVSQPENSPKSTLHSKMIPSAKNGFSGSNTTRWSNKTVDKLLDQLEVEFDDQKRKDIIKKVVKIYTEEIPVIPLYYRSDVSVTPDNIWGYSLSGHQHDASNQIENWRVR